MSLFHIIDDAHAILVSKGVWRQTKVYRRGDELFAGYGGGFIRLYEGGTSLPTMKLDSLALPEDVNVWKGKFDRLHVTVSVPK